MLHILLLLFLFHLKHTILFEFNIYDYESPWYHVWALSDLCYHIILEIFPYPFLVVITQLLFCITFINDCICILDGSPG